MLVWLSHNISNILIGAGLILITGGILYKMRKDKKAGKSSCGCDCGHCSGCRINK